MKKLLLILSLAAFSFTSCEKTEVPEDNNNNNTPIVDCNCGTVTWSHKIFSEIYQISIEGNCGGGWSGLTTKRYTGDVCEWEISTVDGSPVNW